MEGTTKPHHTRRRKHRYRRFVRIFAVAATIIGLVFLVLYLRQSPAPSGPTVSGDDAAVQFK